MKELLKKVYYCGFCKKHSLSRYHLLNHELHCTMNPARKCRMCGNIGLVEYEIKIIKDPLGRESSGIVIGREDCPACALAFIRQHKISYRSNEDGSYWEYKEACRLWWKANNYNSDDY